MKWFCSRLRVTLGFSLISFSSFSTQTVYIQNASQLRSTSASGFYVQVGSFKNKSNASYIQTSLKRKSNYPILLKKKSGYYVVLIGPIQTAAAVRAAVQNISATSARVRAVQIRPNAQNGINHSEQYVMQRTNSNKLINDPPPVSIYKDKDGIPSYNPWFVGAGIGWMEPFGINSTNFASSGMPDFPDDRYVTNRSKGAGQYSVIAGYQWRHGTTWLPAHSLSLGYTYTASASIKGVIFVNDLADSKNFAFNYDISQQLPMAKLKVDLYRWQQLMPYVSAGAGVAFNRVHNYSDWPIPGATLLHRRYGFTSATTAQFAGSIGAGLDYWISNKIQLSLGYELAYYGNVRTGYGQGVLSSNRLGNKLNSNGVVLQAIYFFE